MTRLSASQLQRVAVCPASAVLPRVDSVNAAAARGTALHAFLEAVPVVGRDEALASVPEEYRAACEALDLGALPVCAVRYAAEVAFALDPRTGAARELGRSMGRDYSGALAGEIVGTADVVGLSEDGSTLVVADYKTGRTELAKAERNWQLRFLALAGCRTYGATSAHVALVHVHENGTAHYDSAVFDAFDLAVIAHELRRLADRVAFAERSLRAGEPPLATTGDHCRYCPCLPYCPAQTALVRVVVGELEGEWERPVTPQDAARVYERVKAAKAALGALEKSLYTYAAGNPIPLPNGLVLGQVETTREEVDGATARRVLAELYGPDTAERACEFTTSKAAIERALRPVAQATEQKITHLKREALAAIAAAGGITRNTTTSVREHAPDNRAAKEVVADVAALTAELKGEEITHVR